MNESVLEKGYSQAERPYSDNELENIRSKCQGKLRIGEVHIHHSRCGHRYFARSGGKKEAEALEADSVDVGNCSVCWKISRTPRHLKRHAKDLVYNYTTYLSETPERWTFELVELENMYYIWLYKEFNPPRKNLNRSEQ